MQTIQDTAYGLIPIYVDGDGIHYLLILHNKGHWSFPKGHKEGDETDLAAACREFEEETGIQQYRVLPDLTFREQYSFTYQAHTQINKTVAYFVAIAQTDASGQPPQAIVQREEIADYRWCTYDEAQGAITFDAARGVLTDCHTQLQTLSAAQLKSGDE